jgi:hypothetical protein
MNFPLPGFITDPLLEANATFTKGEIDKLTNGFVGDFKGFQTYFEAFNVSSTRLTISFRVKSYTRRGRTEECIISSAGRHP